MGKLIVVTVFALVCVWALSSFIHMGHTIFMAAGLPVTTGMLIFSGGAGLAYKLVKR
jgi:hypothetical protein